MNTEDKNLRTSSGWLAITLLLVVTLTFEVQAGPSMGAVDHAPGRTWPGVYEGHNDGRDARLTIESKSGTKQRISYDVTLEDLERGTTFTGVGYTANPSARKNYSHIMTFPAPLTASDGQQKEMEQLLLHTWDIDYISGRTEWKGREFGVLFQRR